MDVLRCVGTDETTESIYTLRPFFAPQSYLINRPLSLFEPGFKHATSLQLIDFLPSTTLVSLHIAKKEKMDMDVDMDTPYTVSVFPTREGKYRLTYHLFHAYTERWRLDHACSWIPGGSLRKQHHGVSGHGGYVVNSYGYTQPYYGHSEWQQLQSRPQQYSLQGDYASRLGNSTPTPPPQPHAITGVTVVVDTNVLLDYLMVIQKFVADIERTKWPSVVVIPSVVISELDWYVGAVPACSSSGRRWSELRFFRSS